MPESVLEDIPFHHYGLKHLLTAWVSTHLFDHATYTVRHGLLKGMKRKGGLGWLPAGLSHSIVTPEERFWSALDLDKMTVYDIGAFHGLLTLFFARRAQTVISFEPNSRNRTRLLENLALNRIANVKVRANGVGSQRGMVTMAADPLMPGGASVDHGVVEQLSRSGVKTVVEDVPIVTLDEEIEAGLPAPNFIKIDVEGWELEVLRGARKSLELYKPALFLEMHGATIRDKKRKVAEIVDFLWQIGYQCIDHVETGDRIMRMNSSVAMQGHLYCRCQPG
jgi:FkbM family methyltransferase